MDERWQDWSRETEEAIAVVQVRGHVVLLRMLMIKMDSSRRF